MEEYSGEAIINIDRINEELINVERKIGDPYNIESLESLGNQANSLYTSNAMKSPAEIEREKFTKYSPLITLLIFCIGPLSVLYQVTGEAIDQFTVSYRYKDDPANNPMNLYGFANIIIQVYVYIGAYFSQVSMCTIPKLIGRGEREEAAHIVVDIYRLTLVIAAIFPFGFFWIIKPFVKFEGCPEDQLKRCIDFIMPPTIGILVIVAYNLTGGILMGIGRADWTAYIRIIAYTLQIAVFTPILLFVIKVPIGWIRSSMVFAELITDVIILTLLFRGKFTMKPEFKKLFSIKFHPNFRKYVFLGLPMLFQFICLCIPPTFILQSLTSSMKPDANAIAAAFGVFNRLSTYCNALPHTFTVAFLNVGTHAYATRDYKRFFNYLGWTILFGTIILILFSAIIEFAPRAAAGIFLHTERELQIAETLFRIPFYTVSIQTFLETFNNILLIVGYPYLAYVSSGLKALLLSGGCKLVVLLFPDNPYNIMYIYNITDIVCFIVSLSLVARPLYKMRMELKKDEELFAQPIISQIPENDSQYQIIK